MTRPQRQPVRHWLALLLIGLLPVAPNAAEIRWFELISEDAEASVDFYRELFGWRIERSPTGSLVAYLGDKPIAGISQIEATDNDVRESQWFPSFSVPNATLAADAAEKAGAEIVEGPAYVDGYGDYAVIRDPQGAIMMLANIGAVPVADKTAGNWVWGELWTTDTDGSALFYHALSELTMAWTDTSAGDKYLVLMQGEQSIGGVVEVEDPEFPTRWGGYIAVDDLEDTVEKARKLGGTIFEEELKPYRVAVLADPAGAVFFIYELDAEDAS
ncbi:MAG: VOC family protein [Pseudomonadota bacterium]